MVGNAWLAAALICLTSAAAPAQGVRQSLGDVSFANSGAPLAQSAFLRGLGLLHNFEYSRAIVAFQDAQKADPGFAMAYWGEAMAYNHAVWMKQDADKARAVLGRLGPDPAARLAKAPTTRERGFLEAVEALYGGGSKEDRDRAYSARMETLFSAFPQDVDVAAFYALSLLGLAHDGRDYGLYMRAAGILEQFYPQHSRHPGVLHYLIHSYDDPIHAPLGLRAARLYGAVAPDAAHALHMTSHIFVALGDWKQTIASNVTAIAVVNSQRATAGRPAAMCGHYPEWLNYAYYQVGEPARSEPIRQGCRGAADGEIAEARKTDMRPATRSYADMWVRSVIEQGKRPPDPALNLDPNRYPDESFTLAYGALLAGRGNAADVAVAYGALKRAAAAGTGNPQAPMAARRKIVLLQAAALAAFASGRETEGLKSLNEAAETERAMAPDYGPPLVEKPSFELLGEEYLRLRRHREAADAFRAALKLAPGRRLSLAGLANAERATN